MAEYVIDWLVSPGVITVPEAGVAAYPQLPYVCGELTDHEYVPEATFANEMLELVLV